MNIVAMAMPTYAYVDPTYFGGAEGADRLAWGLAYVFADGKMRALFSMLFGASLLIVTDAAEGRTPGPARAHYARMAVLLGFGMIHAWLIWYGDILFEYALGGMLVFVARKWPPSALIYAILLLIGWEALHDLISWRDLSILQQIATGPNAPADAVREWQKVVDEATPYADLITEEIRLYRGGFGEVFAARAPMTMLFQSVLTINALPATMGFMGLGMLLFRLGFWAGAWRRRTYAGLVAAGAAALVLHVPLAAAILAHDFDPAFLPLADLLSLLLRPFVATGYAASIILLVRAGALEWLIDRLAAAGRMAFSNYLGTSLIMTTIFYGYGLGQFGQWSRAELYWIVLAQCLAMLILSKPWLAHFRYGPLEWAWRSAARGALQPMSR